MKSLKIFGIAFLLYTIILSIRGQESTAIVPIPPSAQLIHFSNNGNGECTAQYREYPNSYLRFVARPHHTNFVTSYMDCFRRCCTSASFLCKSFSYFWQTRQCFLMNVTQHDDGVVLAHSRVHVHIELDGHNRTLSASAIPSTAAVVQPQEEIPDDDSEEKIKFGEKDNSESAVEEVSPTESSEITEPAEQKGPGVEESDEALISVTETSRVYVTPSTANTGRDSTPSYNGGSGSDMTSENNLKGNKQPISSAPIKVPTSVTVATKNQDNTGTTTERPSGLGSPGNEGKNDVSKTESYSMETKLTSANSFILENGGSSSVDESQSTKSAAPDGATSQTIASTVSRDGSPSQRPTAQPTTRTLAITETSSPPSNFSPSAEMQSSTKILSSIDQRSSTAFKNTPSRSPTPPSRLPSTDSTTQQLKTTSFENLNTAETPTSKLSETTTKATTLATKVSESSAATRRSSTTLRILPTTKSSTTTRKVLEPTIRRSTTSAVLQPTTLTTRPTTSQSSTFSIVTSVSSISTTASNENTAAGGQIPSTTLPRETARNAPARGSESTDVNTARSLSTSSPSITSKKFVTTTTSPPKDITISSPTESALSRSKKPSEGAESSVTKRTDDAKTTTSQSPATISRRTGTLTATGKITFESTHRQKVVSCNLKCYNGGYCSVGITIGSDSKVESCKCVNGFRGDQCEILPPVSRGGFAWWVIALIVLAVVFLVCAIGVYASYLIYRRRNMIGKYNVARERRVEARSLDTLDDFDKMASYSTLGWYERPRRHSWRSSGTFSTAASV